MSWEDRGQPFILTAPLHRLFSLLGVGVGGISSDRNKPRHPSHPHGGRRSPRGGARNDTRWWRRRRHLEATKCFVNSASATQRGDKGRGRLEKVP